MRGSEKGMLLEGSVLRDYSTQISEKNMVVNGLTPDVLSPKNRGNMVLQELRKQHSSLHTHPHMLPSYTTQP